jgi:hypothetical protein
MGLTQNLGLLSTAIKATSTLNVGIGTSPANSKLHISKASSETAPNEQIRMQSTGGAVPSTWRFDVNAGNGSFSITDNSVGERMTITSGGQLQVKQAGNTFSDGLRLINTSNNTWTTLAGGDNDYYFGYNGNAAAKITPAGTYIPFSDINRKKDFEVSTIGLNAILSLKPTLYRIKTDDENINKQLGFIAQEVKEFIPQAYSESKNGDETFIGLNYNAITAALVKAVQELKAEIDQLKNK